MRNEARTTGRIALIAETAADARDVMILGDSGIMACSPPWDRPTYNPSLRRLTWSNGAQAHTYSGEDPDQLRGPQHGAAWVDEIAKMRLSKDVWEQLEFGLRLGDRPRVLVTTTPRPIPVLKTIMARSTTVITRGHTYANAANLADTFIQQMRETYEGTRIGRQELAGDMLDDTPGALWTYALIDQHRIREDVSGLQEVVIGIDPTGSFNGDECGIVAAGRRARDYFVLEDASTRGTPLEWAKTAIRLYDREDILADRIVVERNYGGDMVATTVRTAAEQLWRSGERPSPEVNVVDVTASRGKALRAEPVSALYEQGRVHHVGEFKKLEDQMSRFTPNWDRARDGSPDRLDAKVFAITDLMRRTGSGVVGGVV